MAIYTQNYHLKKPEDGDFYNVEDFNGNMDIVDTQFTHLTSETNSIKALLGESENSSGDDTVMARLGAILEAINSVKANLTSVSSDLTNKINTINTNVDGTNQKLNTLSTHLDSANQKLDTLSTDLSTTSQKVTSISSTVSTISSRTSTISTNVSSAITKIDALSTDADNIISTLSTINTNVNTVSKTPKVIKQVLRGRTSGSSNGGSQSITISPPVTGSKSMILLNNSVVGDQSGKQQGAWGASVGGTSLIIYGNCTLGGGVATGHDYSWQVVEFY